MLTLLLASFTDCRKEPIARTSPPAPHAATDAPLEPAAPGTVDCGQERNVHGQGYDPTARACFWDAYQAHHAARLVVTMHTIEGDPVRYELRSREPTGVELVIDSHDRFGAPGITRADCETLTKQLGANGRFGFRALGCKGRGSAPEVTIP